AEENPLAADEKFVVWPLNPLGGRGEAVHGAAADVRGADPTAETPWSGDIDLLLAERRRRMHAEEYVAMPDRVPASRFKDFVTDAAGLAAKLRRPVPEKPYRQTRLGTLFHSWVEQRSGIAGGQ